ncbi:hypothetical protein [Picrophilus oshimae]|uniref:Uncharacterized protein n=1 Tax=Picrophilus torridus (strain ATCC 700027 / DSM 9790 / JCM 10055 / NBRC 100828 / KAW 2/3) TaxID=1122961 RepID=A0A8G2FXM5_PICTO|nr:hypothetical protein [Picrophilus oshimae]SMD31336.1 hypothetical protein SAMN02745355_1264 [Picrophilus oshimae DSM 9789]
MINGGSYGIIIFIIIIGIIVVARFARNYSGYKFRISRLIRRPLIYVFLLLLSLFSSGNYEINAMTMLFIFPGIIAGSRSMDSIEFFMSGGTLYYKRPVIIMIFWLLSLIAREILVLMFPGNIYIIITVNAVLALTTGIIIGEAIATYKKYKIFNDGKLNKDME